MTNFRGGAERYRPFLLCLWENAISFFGREAARFKQKKAARHRAALSFEGEPPQTNLVCDGTVNT